MAAKNGRGRWTEAGRGWAKAARGEGAGTTAWKFPSRQISLRIGGKLGSASHPVNLKVEGELLPRPAKKFTGQSCLRDLIGQHFSRGPVFWRLFCGLGHYTGSARDALTLFIIFINTHT